MIRVITSKNSLRKTRHKRVRGKVRGTADQPRLNVFKSLRFIYAQLINDEENKVIAEANSQSLLKKKSVKPEEKMKVVEEVGKLIAEKGLKKGVKKVVFDRGGYKYHGQVKTLAESARKAGLQF